MKQNTKNHTRQIFFWSLLILVAVLFLSAKSVSAAPVALPRITFGLEKSTSSQDMALSLQILFLLTVLSLAPAILMLITSFTRIIVVLSFIRSALGLQQMPPNQVLIGLALFLTFFIMHPVYGQINQEALQPYFEGEITQEEAFEKGVQPIRNFMFKQTREKDLALFINLSQTDRPMTRADVPTHVLIPAFITSELKTAFQIGFLIYIPFLVIDMIVSSTLMSMGMMMLPPIMISLPFKILLFVLVDGWHLVVRSLVLSFIQ